MSSTTINEVRLVAANLFSCDINTIHDQSGPGDILRWDSLGHIQFLEALAERFKCEIPLEAAIEAQTISDIAKLIDSLYV